MAEKTPREQIGGDHYRTPPGIPEHWDIAWALGWDFYQYQITKYLWRWKQKGGMSDLRKAQHFLTKYLEVVGAEQARNMFAEEPGPGYVNQDPDVASPSGPARPTSADSPAVESAGLGTSMDSSFIWINGHMYQRVK